MAIQENDILSGRPLVMSFPNNTEFEEGITIFSSDKYFVDVSNDNDVIIIAMRDAEDTVLATLYAYNTDTQTTVTNLTSYTLPNDFGIVTSIDTGSDAYQYIIAIMGTPIASDTLDMSTYGQAAKVATNYMTWSAEYGLVISEDATEDPGDMQGGNTRITSDGMEVYKGQNRVAHFGEEVILGDEESANAYLDPDTFKITNVDGVDFFSVDMDGNPITTNIYKNIIKYVDGASSMELVLSDGAFDRVPSGGVITVYLYETGSPNSTTQWSVTKGTASTEAKTGSGSGISHTLTYDGIHTLTVSGQTGSYTRWNLVARGTGQVDAPSFMLGTRDGGSGGTFSTTAGSGLTADGDYQFVVGRYNDNDPDNAFEIGNGGNTAQKVTIFSVDKTGNAKGNNIPTMTECGAITDVPNVPSHSYYDYEVSFPKRFSSAPIVVVGMMSSSTGYGTGSVSVSAHSIATYGFTARIFNNDSTARSPHIHWIAMLA